MTATVRMVLACCLLWSFACQAPTQPPPAKVPPPPDLDRFDRAVARQLSEAHGNAVRLAAEAGPRAAQALGRLGSLYLAYQLNDAALHCFEEAVRLAPSEPAWAYYLAVLMQEEGENDEASRLLASVLERQPDNTAARVRLANLQLESGHTEDAERSFREALGRHPDLAAAHFGLGRLAALRGDHRKAVEAFETTLKLQPAANRTHYALAQSYRRLGRLDQAKEHLSKRGEVGVGFPDPALSSLAGLTAGAPGCAYRGDQAALQGRLQDALGEYLRAVSLAPANPLYRRSLALTQHKLGDPESAIASIQEAIGLETAAESPNSAALSMDHYTLGGMLANRGSLPEAVKHFQIAVELDSSNIEAHFQLGRAAGASGRLSEALGHLEAALRINPRHLEATRLTATALMDLGRFGEALPHLRRLLELEPQNDLNRRLLKIASDRAVRPGSP